MNSSVLIIGNFHHKNKAGMLRMFIENNVKFKLGTIQNIPEYDVIFSPCQPINASMWPDKKFIFGPHFFKFLEK